jgi:hypothetical protein
MKKLIILILLTTFQSQICTHGQEFNPLQKGNLMIAGSFSGSYEQKEMLDFNYAYELDFRPTVGYFIYNKFAIGVTPAASIRWSRINPLNKFDKQINFEFAPMFRYYFWNKLYISFEPAFIIGHLTTNRIDSKTKGYSFNQGVGYDLFISKNIALEIGYYYYYSKQKVDEIYETQFPFTSDLITNKFKLNIGIQVIL